MTVLEKDIKIKPNEWADKIDNCKDRNAINDLSILAYRMLNVIIALQKQGKKNERDSKE